jgi:hypothetical protein
MGEPDASTSSGTITVKRRTWLQDLVRRYTVFVDGSPVGTLWAFQTGNYQVAPGTHQVRVGIVGTGTASSADVVVGVVAGGTQVLRTGGRGTASLLKLPLSLPAGAKAQLSGDRINSRFYKGPWINLMVESPQTKQ